MNPERLHDRYDLVRPLGSGGASTTWLATDTQTGARVTVKRLSTPLQPGCTRPDRETAVLSQLDHPQIPRFVEAFVETWRMSDYLYLVLEYVDGEPLADVLERKRFEQSEVDALIADLLGIVSWLHALAPPLIHRDIKPSNLIVRPDGRLVLIDFGLATDGVDRTFLHTMAVGTLGYQAPEQIGGEPVPASDVYSIGAVALALLTRTAPKDLLSGRTLDWKGKAAHLTQSWRTWLERALEPDPTRRFRDAADALEALRTRRPATPRASERSEGRTVGLPAWIPGVLVVCLVVVLVPLALSVGATLYEEPVQEEAAPIAREPVAVEVVRPTPPPAPTSTSVQENAARCRAGDTPACLAAAEQLSTPDATGRVPRSSIQLRRDLLGQACLVHHPPDPKACALLDANVSTVE